MNFLGVGPGELILILILLLVVVGPERLPGLARSFGRNLVRVRNWMQTSPDAALVLRARQELEAELAEIRASLLEVQSVRDEVLDVAKQLDDAVTPITNTRASLADLIREPADKPLARTSNGMDAPSMVSADPVAAPVDAQIAPPQDAAVASADEPPAALDVLAPSDSLGVDVPASAPALPSGTPNNLELRIQALADELRAFHEQARVEAALKTTQLESLMADMHALQQQLKERGLLASDWEPPSWRMYLPSQQPDAPTKEADR